MRASPFLSMCRTPFHRVLSLLARPLGLPYARALSARRSLFAKGRLCSYVPACPTVSIGNIALGGTGKTPLVSWLLDWAAAKNLRAAVLTRGYGGAPGRKPLLVTPTTPVSSSGDEPLMLATAHPRAFVLAFPRRSESARLAESELSPDLFILDDGMQHLAVTRDLDIVLLRPEDLEKEWDRVLPGGFWREGASALSAAHAFVLKMPPLQFREYAPSIRQRLGSFRVPVFSYDLEPVALRALLPPGATPERISRPDSEMPDAPYLLVSGVGNPSGVAATAARFMGRQPHIHLVFQDHHAYSERDALNILGVARLEAEKLCRKDPLPVLCSSKDAVKLVPLHEHFENCRVWELTTAPVFGPGLFTDFGFPEWWEVWWERHKGGRP